MLSHYTHPYSIFNKTLQGSNALQSIENNCLKPSDCIVRCMHMHVHTHAIACTCMQHKHMRMQP